MYYQQIAAQFIYSLLTVTSFMDYLQKDGCHLWINPEIVKLRLVEAFERHTIYVISELPFNSSWTRTTVDDKMWNTKHNELLPMPSMNKELTHSLLIINNTIAWK